jgi:membrane protease YdiL (CAAX protease family)
LLFAGFILLFGPLPEEIGWRGYALDRLQARCGASSPSTGLGQRWSRWNALAAGLLLGAAWGVWHIPLFFMPGYYGDALPQPAEFMFAILMTSVLITWIYNNTRRSVLAAVLYHFMVNFTGELLPTSVQVDLYRTALTALVVLCVVLWWGPAILRRGEERKI